MNIERFETSARRSDMVLHDNTLYIGGQVAANTQGDIEAQTREILGNIEAMLLSVGSNLSRVLSVRILLADRADYAGLNRAWDGFFPEGHAPTRACTLAELINPDWRVEMIVVAGR
ncbi:MAG: RidA family protein [Pseudomonas sp.]|uniref:Enamine deaminase RidA, house cleaning of reactive enamine intermediates, YjgF/YER057c/UK114 family n=1 Tax=Pseudomonas guineae TaxID=425504 RepID=A0A1I3DV54_9PSED|nr:RidA family protein [Pseudomonas guineae]MDX1300068.1 RidA family protein [Pseudomonas sp.]SFH90523.1 Enamine deaminase RidA, house cleaning of reactive enamine intermediates, YjgF/YER057c/UK114 family [Pseudomonas guineae]